MNPDTVQSAAAHAHATYQPIHQATLDRLIRSAYEPTEQRLNSLTTLHTMAWLDATSYTNSMTATRSPPARTTVLAADVAAPPVSG